MAELRLIAIRESIPYQTLLNRIIDVDLFPRELWIATLAAYLHLFLKEFHPLDVVLIELS